MWHLVGVLQPDAWQQTLKFVDKLPPLLRRDRRAEIRAFLEAGPRSAQNMAEDFGITKEGVLRWLRRMEKDGEVRPTSKSRRSRFNQWELVRGTPSP